MDANKKQILDTFIRIIHHISDKEYQRKVWIRAEGPDVDDFDETVCHFFQEGDGILEKYRDFEISKAQYQLLTKFRNEFKVFCDLDEYYLPEEFIDSPEWTKITNLAQEVLKTFKR